jgi:APA family basic amino acid/polyamine antiporter
MAVGAMLGTGVFVLPGIGIGLAGQWVCLSFLIGGLIVLPAVFTKAELATAMPVSGGAYIYVDRAMGPWMGTIAGLGTWLSLSFKTAFQCVALGAYLVLFSDIPPMTFTLICLTALIGLNLVGVGKVAGIQKIIVFICLISLAFYCWGGVSSVDFSRTTEALPYGWFGIFEGAAILFSSYAGVTKVCSIAEEVHHPSRNLPLGMLAAHFSVMIVYLAVGYVIGGNVAPADIATSATPITTAGVLFLNETTLQYMAIVAVIGLIASANAGVLSLSRFPFAMARDNLLPKQLDVINKRYGTPVRSILMSGAVLFMLIAWVPLMTLAKLASGFKIFVFSANHVALIVLRETGARWYRPSFRSPFYPFIQIFGIVSSLSLLFFLGPVAIAGVFGGILLGTVWYLIYARKRASRGNAFQHLWGEAKILRETETAEAEEEMTDQAPRVIVPIFSGQTDTRHLVRLGASFVELGVLEVVRLDEVPEQLHLMDQIDGSGQKEKTAAEAEEVCHELQIALDFHDVVTHNAKHALLSHAQATHAHWLVMDWPETSRHSRLVRDPMAWWLDHPPCDLAVFRDRGANEFKRILVLAEPGPYDSLVTHVADRLALQEEGKILIYRAVSNETTDDEMKSISSYHDQLGEMIVAPNSSLVERCDDTLAAIVQHSANFDLIIMGAHAEKALKTLLFGSYEHRLAEAVSCSILRLKTPRDMVHPRLGMSLVEQPGRLELGPAINAAPLGVKLEVRSKEALFTQMAKNLATSLKSEPRVVEAAIWQRERFQSTGLSGGLSLMAATCPSLTETCFGVITTQTPIDFRGPGRRQVDTFFAILSPPAERQKQLWLLAQFARMTLRTDFLPAVRKAETEEELRAVLTKFGGNGLL